MPGLRRFSTPDSLQADRAHDAAAEEPLRLGTLGTAEGLFLRSFRGWSQGRECWSEVWNEHAKRFGSADGRLLLHLFRHCHGAVREAANRPILHHPPCCPYLAPDEARLTAILCATALARRDSARFIGHVLFGTDELAGVLAAMAKLANAYGARGLSVAPNSPLACYGEAPLGYA